MYDFGVLERVGRLVGCFLWMMWGVWEECWGIWVGRKGSVNADAGPEKGVDFWGV